MIRESTAGSAARPPRWARLVCAGTTTITLDNAARIGLAVTSHQAGTLAIATFDQATTSPAGNG